MLVEIVFTRSASCTGLVELGTIYAVSMFINSDLEFFHFKYIQLIEQQLSCWL